MMMIGLCDIVFNVHYTTYFLEIFGCETTVLSFEFLLRTIVEQPGVHEVPGSFGGRDTIHWYRFRQLGLSSVMANRYSFFPACG